MEPLYSTGLVAISVYATPSSSLFLARLHELSAQELIAPACDEWPGEEHPNHVWEQKEKLEQSLQVQTHRISEEGRQQ